MATFLELQTRVATRVIDSPAAVSGEIPTLINEALRAIQDQHNFRVMKGTLSETTVLATRALVSTPSDWKEARGRPYSIPFVDGPATYMEFSPSREFVQTVVNVQANGAPRFLLRGEPTDDLGASTLEVWPLPDGESDYSDGEYRVVIPYWRYIPALSADGDTNWFTINAVEYLIHTATGMAFAVDWDENHLAEWAQLGAGQAQRVIKRDKLQDLGDVTTLVPQWRGANSPRSRE